MAKHRKYRVSDHALVRYLEHVRGICLDDIRREIEAKLEFAEAHQPSAAIVDGHRYVLEDNTVITVHSANKPMRGQNHGRDDA